MGNWECVLSNTKVCKATLQLARFFADMDPTEVERPVTDKRRKILKEEMIANRFSHATWAYGILPNGTNVRLNGQGCSQAALIVKEETGEFPDFLVSIVCYKVRNMQDAADLFGTFDSAESARSATQLMNTISKTHKMETPTRLLRLAAGAIASSVSPGEEYAMRKYNKQHLVVDHPAVRDFVCEALSAPDATFLRTQAVANVIASTFLVAPRKAKEFWNKITDGSDNAVLPIRQYILNTKGGHGSGSDRQIVEYNVRKAWRAWHDGQKWVRTTRVGKPIEMTPNGSQE
jgi:hypothetical protein